MEELKFAKPKKGTKHSRKSIHDFSKEVKRKEYEEAKGICRICHDRPITQYHHANEKGMGGGRGLGIQINCIGLCDICHNHDNTEMLQQTKEILRERIETLFEPNKSYITSELDQWLKTDFSVINHQIQKGFLKVYLHTSGTAVTEIDDIKRWLGVSA